MSAVDHAFIQKQRLAYDFILEHGVAHSYDVTYGRDGFSGGFWATSEETQEALARALAMSNYQRPKWWHFWAWGENKPSRKLWQRVLELRASPSP